MKKFIALALSVVLALSMVACGGREDNASSYDVAKIATTIEDANPIRMSTPIDEFYMAFIGFGEVDFETGDYTLSDNFKSFAGSYCPITPGVDIILAVEAAEGKVEEVKSILEAKKAEEVDIFELSIDENITTPLLGKQSSKIREFQTEQKNFLNELKLKGYPYTIELLRNNEVISITIEARHLFKANDTILADSGKEKLKPILKFLNKKDYYKMVLAMHSDNTGNNTYCINLTTKRVNSVYDWIHEEIKSDISVVPYALGSTDPIINNNSIANRQKNRRLVIYLIPSQGMINNAKKGNVQL